MEELKEKTRDLVDHVEDLAETFYRLTMVNAAQKAANVGSGIVLGFVLVVVSFFCVFFLACALAWWLGDLVNSRAGGFLLTGGFMLLVIGILVFFRKKAILPLMRNLIVRKLYE